MAYSEVEINASTLLEQPSTITFLKIYINFNIILGQGLSKELYRSFGQIMENEKDRSQLSIINYGSYLRPITHLQYLSWGFKEQWFGNFLSLEIRTFKA